MQLVLTWFYYENCCRLYLAYSVVGTHDLEMRVTLINTWCRFLFVPWGELEIYCDRLLYYYYCCTPFGGRTHWNFMYVLPHLHARNCLWKKNSAASKMWYYWRTVTQFPRVELPSDLRSATICIEVSCMMSYLFLGGREILSSSTKRKALYTLLYPVFMIAVCSVVDRIGTILLYVLLDRYKDARKRYST